MSTDLITIKDICQKVFDFFTIFADLLVRWPIEDRNLLSLICFISIAFVAILLGAFGMSLLDASHEGKNRILNIFEFDAGVDVFNISGGKDTVELVNWVRDQYPDFPIIACGGKTDESIEATIDAGANAITYTAYGMMEEYFHHKMETYRH